MKIFNMTKKQGSYGFPTCQEMAQAIVANVDKDNSTIDKIELK